MTEENKWIGKRTPRPDGADKVTGRAAYAADTTMPGMIWGKVLRSPHPHARIKSIDTSKAEKLPGVRAVVTAKDIVDFPIEKGPVMLGIQDMRWMCRNVMAREKALFHGHPGRRRRRRQPGDRRRGLQADRGRLRGSALGDRRRRGEEADGAPILHDHVKFDGKPSNIAGRLEHKLGDVEAGFKEAEVIVERSFKTEAVHQGYIEPHACLVSLHRRQGHGVELEPGPVHGPRHVRADCRASRRATSARSRPRSAAASAARRSSISSRWRWRCRASRAGRSRW